MIEVTTFQQSAHAAATTLHAAAKAFAVSFFLSATDFV
jgi:hypothetical protein